jgi:aryl-alcohol dehydrogenase-like predicted oxidoreductase
MMDMLKPNPKLYDVPWMTDRFNGMPFRRLGRSGLRVPNVALGTWKMGYPDTGDKSRVGEKESLKILDRALELGVTHWDTANRYNMASGNSERIIGKWLAANRDERRNVTIATKLFGGMDGITPNHSRLSRMNVLDATYACLKRLQIDMIDVMYFHSFDAQTPVEESLEAMEDLVRRDVVRYFAVSNYSPEKLKIYDAVADSLSERVRIHGVQNGFNILDGERPTEAGALDYCARHGISYIAWSPLARGLLTNRYLDPAKAGKGDRLVDEGALEQVATPEKIEKVRRLAEIAGPGGLTVSQLVLAYMLALPGMGPVIPSATTIAQLEENAKAGAVRLEEEQLLAVRRVLEAEKAS